MRLRPSLLLGISHPIIADTSVRYRGRRRPATLATMKIRNGWLMGAYRDTVHERTVYRRAELRTVGQSLGADRPGLRRAPGGDPSLPALPHRLRFGRRHARGRRVRGGHDRGRRRNRRDRTHGRAPRGPRPHRRRRPETLALRDVRCAAGRRAGLDLATFRRR